VSRIGQTLFCPARQSLANLLFSLSDQKRFGRARPSFCICWLLPPKFATSPGPALAGLPVLPALLYELYWRGGFPTDLCSSRCDSNPARPSVAVHLRLCALDDFFFVFSFAGHSPPSKPWLCVSLTRQKSEPRAVPLVDQRPTSVVWGWAVDKARDSLESITSPRPFWRF